jgi:bla regulator protein BlaR1
MLGAVIDHLWQSTLFAGLGGGFVSAGIKMGPQMNTDKHRSNARPIEMGLPVPVRTSAVLREPGVFGSFGRSCYCPRGLLAHDMRGAMCGGGTIWLRRCTWFRGQRIEEIMANRKLSRLDAGRKLLLAGAGVLAVAGPIAIGIVNAPPMRGQAQAAHLEFEAASVKPHKPGDNQLAFPDVSPGGRFTSRGMPLIMVIELAYGLPIQGSPRLTGGPSWIESRDNTYDIEAAAPKGAFPDGLSYKARTERMGSMLQTMLAERFKLVIHRETKEMPVYALVAAKGGPKLQKADIDEKDCPEGPVTPSPNAPLLPFPRAPGADRNVSGAGRQPCHAIGGGRGAGLHGRAVSMADLVGRVEAWTDRPLLDKTGIKGLYRIDTTGWQPMQVAPFAPGAKQDGVEIADLPTIFTVFEKLGLKMESAKGRVDVYAIDHVEKPTGN